MDQAWRCPACHTIVAYDDFNAANTGAIFPCRKCGLLLIIDRTTGQPVAATKPPRKPTGSA